jgi:hypothetical protein
MAYTVESVKLLFSDLGMILVSGTGSKDEIICPAFEATILKNTSSGSPPSVELSP